MIDLTNVLSLTLVLIFTYTKRLTAEWKNGSFEEHLRKSTKKSYRSFNYDVFNEHRHSSPCPLLKVRWLRLVVDEGHSMGKKGPPTNSIDFSSWITSDYRWSLTGTPTPQHVARNGYGLGNLIGLLKFLKFQYFSTSHWGEEVSKEFETSIGTIPLLHMSFHQIYLIAQSTEE